MARGAALSDAPPHRRIRSFVLRGGRQSPAAARALELLAPRYALAFDGRPIDLRAAFGRMAPTVLEIGFGVGTTTAEIAAAHPRVDFLAVDVYAQGVANLLRLIDARGLGNVRIVQHDAVDVVDAIAPGALGGVHVYFPDPWPKKRHHKRRLMQPDFAALAASRLAPGGRLHAATDWREYAEHMLEVLSGVPGMRNCAADFAPRPPWRPETKFEKRGLGLGHGVWDLVFTRE